MTILEAFAHKTLVVSSDIGAMKSIIRHKQNGLLFTPNDSKDLLKQLGNISNEQEVTSMVNEAYSDFSKYYSDTANYALLMERYEAVIQAK